MPELAVLESNESASARVAAVLDDVVVLNGDVDGALRVVRIPIGDRGIVQHHLRIRPEVFLEILLTEGKHSVVPAFRDVIGRVLRDVAYADLSGIQAQFAQSDV